MSEERVIPIFPLSIVVFPGQSVPLHIYVETGIEAAPGAQAAGQVERPQPRVLSGAAEKTTKDHSFVYRFVFHGLFDATQSALIFANF